MAIDRIDGQKFLKMVINAHNRLEEKKEYVDSLNVFPVPDGDTGTNMSMTFKAAANSIAGSDETSIGKMSKDLAKGALMGARGNSGVILSQILRGIAKGLENIEEATAQEFASSIKEGAVSAYRAVMRPTEGTILTVIRETGDKAVELNAENFEDLFAGVTEQAEKTLEKTPDLLPQLKEAKVVDSGGMGLLIILKGLREAIENNFAITESKAVSKTETQEARGAVAAPVDIKYGYCTEFIVKGAIEEPDFREYLESMGDSIVFVTMDDITKIHIHTENPGEVMQRCQKHGELLKIKIENMREQNRTLHEHVESDFVQSNLSKEKEDEEKNEAPKKFGFISVAAGEGLSSVFKDMGCDVVIEGGQTMNPSTEDIVKAIEKVNADDIFVFPNNKNIIMSANQSLYLTEKKVHVIPTKTIPQGISCLTAFDHEGTAEENLEIMEEARKAVKSASVTFAVRDTEVDGKSIHAGDFLGLLENRIELVERELYPLGEKLIDEMVNEDTSVISVYYGKDTVQSEVDEFVARLEEKHPDHDVIAFNGMQPIYYLIMSVE